MLALVVGHFFQRLLADAEDEFPGAVAAFVFGGGIEPREVLLALRGRPLLRLAEHVGIPNLLGVLRRRAQQRERFLDDIRRVEPDEELAEFAVQVERFRGILPAQFFNAELHHLVARSPLTDEADFDDAELVQLPFLIQRIERELCQRLEQRLLVFLCADASESEEGSEGGARTCLRQSSFSPFSQRTTLQKNSGAKSNVAILIKAQPCDCHRIFRRRTLSELQEIVRDLRDHPGHWLTNPNLAIRSNFHRTPMKNDRRLRIARLGLGPLVSDITHPIKPRLRPPSADGEIHRAVLAEFEIGDGQPFSRNENLHVFARVWLILIEARGHRIFRSVTPTCRAQIDGEDAAISPVHDVERVFVSIWEVALRAELHARRRAAADVHDRAERVGVVVGPFRRALAEAELRARDDVQDARVAIPRQAHVPLHVAVVGEKLAVGVEVEVVSVAETGGEQLPLFAIGIGAQDVAVGRLELVEKGGHRVFDPGEQVVLGEVPVGRFRGEALDGWRGVAVGDVEHFVRADDHAVRAVLAAATGHFFEQLRLVEIAVAIRVAQAVDGLPVRPLPAHVKAVEGPQHAHRRADVELDPVLLRDLSAVVEREAQDAAVGRLVLRRNVEPAFVVHRHRNPRALARRGGFQQLDFETRRDFQLLRRSRARRLHVEKIAPRLRAEFRDGRDIRPRGVLEAGLVPALRRARAREP